MSSNIWRANFSDCNCTDTRSCCFLDLLICTFQIELHYFNMKIATTWTLSCDANAEPGRRNRVWQRVFLLSIHCGSGTSRSANHNTVGTMIALPSLHANVVSRLSSPPPHPPTSPSSVCFGCPLLFPNGNFEVDWCCRFWANGSTHKGDRMRDGARFEERQQESCGGKVGVLTGSKGI